MKRSFLKGANTAIAIAIVGAIALGWILKKKSQTQTQSKYAYYY